MIGSRAILDFLDALAVEFRFPVLDNATRNLIAARLRGFKRDSDWGLVFEVLSFSQLEVAFTTDIYGYGPLVGGEGSCIAQLDGIGASTDHPLWDENGSWIQGRHERFAIVGGTELSFVTTNGPPGSVRLSDGDWYDDVTFGRAVSREVGLRRVLPSETLLDAIPGLIGAKELLRLANWDHPDVSGGQRPSDSLAIVSAARVLSGESPELDYDHHQDNVHSWMWAR